jgi:arylsulfatase A-like enzyme
MTQPNVILVLIDDMGWRDLSCYGSEFYETPNIDSLCRDGMQFSDAYAACPVCSPTRASILTGRYPSTVGVTNFIDSSCHVHPKAGKLIEVPYFRELPRTERTLARSLKDNGYSTWHVGKWHLGGRASYPEKHGFDVNIGGSEAGAPYGGGYFSPWTLPGLTETDVPDGTYLTDYLTDQAVHLIESSAGSSQPFFLNMWYYSVHSPIEAKTEKIEKYRRKAREMGIDTIDPFSEGGFFPTEDISTERIRRRTIQSDPVYAAMIESLDENVGRLLDAVDQSGKSDDTIVIFTSDNGGLSSAETSPTCNAPLSEGKGWRYEGGTREPLIVRWPGVIAPGSESSQPVTSPDLFPTILDAAGLPPEPDAHCDGHSFADLLRGEVWTRPEPLYWHYPHYGNQGDTPGSSIRDGAWKLLEFFEDGHFELYNLEDDLGEEEDLAPARPDKVSELAAKLHSWEARVMAKRPVENPEYDDWEGREPCGHPHRLIQQEVERDD